VQVENASLQQLPGRRGCLHLVEIVLIAVGLLLILVGLIGCVLPVLPGPPLSFAGIIALWAARGWNASTFGETEVIVLGAAAAVTTVLDYITPAWGAKKYGASGKGVWGSVIGMIVGIIWFPPFGMILGSFVGAVLGELLAGKEGPAATRAAWGVFLGTILGIFLKLAASGVITWTFFAELLS